MKYPDYVGQIITSMAMNIDDCDESMDSDIMAIELLEMTLHSIRNHYRNIGIDSRNITLDRILKDFDC